MLSNDFKANDDDLNIQYPRGSQDGHGISKVISRNPANLGNAYPSADVTVAKTKKKDIFIFNELG